MNTSRENIFESHTVGYERKGRTNAINEEYGAKEKKSKRTTLKDKYKIKRRVAEHHRKARRAAKKWVPLVQEETEQRSGIPNLWPFKEQLLKQIEKKREQMEEAKEEAKRRRQKALAKKRKEKMKMKNASYHNNELAEMASSAQSRNEFFQQQSEIKAAEQAKINPAQNAADKNSANNAVATRCAFYKELNKMMDDADVLLEVLDARDPLGCRARNAESKFLGVNKDRRIVLVLNKIDLVPPEVVEKWLVYLRREYPCVAFKASTQVNGRVGQASKKGGSNVSNTSLAVGADTLLQLIKNYSRCHKMKKAITVGVIGFPNVGKSSLINSLKRSRAVGVSSQPGYTKVMQEVQLDKKVKLLDSPGVIFQDDTIDNTGLLLRNCISVDALEDPIPTAEAIIGRCRAEQLMAQYYTTRFNSAGEFLYLLAQQQGKLKKGGIPDKERAARNLVQDWNTGKIPFYTLPPKEAPKQNAVILEQYSKEFNLEEVYPEQMKALKELPEQDEDDFMSLSAPPPQEGRERGWSYDDMDEDED